ncbi:MAG: helix-turn-helix domain-containing protein, partial [Actinoallomurus sp.]
ATKRGARGRGHNEQGTPRMITATAPDPDDDLLTPREVARMCGVSAVTVGRWARTEVLKPFATTLGGQRRFRRVDVHHLQESNGHGLARQQLEEDAVRLYDQGRTIRQVAEKLDISYGVMRRILLRRHAVRHPSQRPSGPSAH